jgi:epoxyqueuosine reductase
MPGEYTRNAVQRAALKVGHDVSELLYPLAKKALPYRPRMWWIPRLPVWAYPKRAPHAEAWTTPIPAPHEALTTGPGITLLPERQQEAFDEAPLHDFIRLHPGMRSQESPTGHMWLSLLETSPRVQAAARKRARSNVDPGATGPARRVTPPALTEALKLEAARLGLSAVGVTAYDIKWNYAEYHGLNVGDTIIVGILEQNFDSTQMSPSPRAEKAALTAYAGLEDRMRKLADWIRAQGYDARAEGFVGESMVIPYAVQAGLGQLGLNGQLLTPHAGSRCRIEVMSTNAPFVHDRPVDFGIEGVCNECQICVKRCPAGAIPANRKESRGVVKAKLNTKRCLPVMGKAAGCSVCMKTCPVQRYGLPAVLEEFERNGTILGKDTDDLEGFDWPIDGKHYGPRERPRLAPEFYEMPGFDFDPDRKHPAGWVAEGADGPDESDGDRVQALGY